MKQYFWNILISIDQLANTLLGGDPDETISSRVGKRSDDNKFWGSVDSFINAIFGRKHTEEAIEPDEGKDSAL